MATNKDFIVKNGLSVGEDISVSGSVTSNLQFDDSVQIKLGTDSDLLIYHDGSHARLREVTGEFRIQTTSGGVNAFVAKQNAEVELFHAGSVMLATTATGVDITGNAVLSGELRGPASFVIDPATVGNNTGAVVIKGDLTVEGTTTTVNSTTLNVADINITVANGAADAAAANGGGMTIAGAGAIFAWNNALGSMTLNKELRLDNNKGLFFATAAGNATVGLKADTSDNITFRQNGNWDRLVIKNTGVDVSGIMTASGNIVTTANVSAGTYTGITLGGSLSGNYTDAKVQYGTAFVGTAAQGHFFFDSLNQKLKVYTGSAFVDAVPASGGGGGGGGSSDATTTFRKYTYTLASSTNAVSGMEDDIISTTNFISGRKYQITTVGNTDFTAIGAGSNAAGVVFVSTGVGGGTTGRAREVLFYDTSGIQNIEVYVNGVKAVEGSTNDYIATTGTSVTFTSNLAVGDVVDVQVYELLTNDSYYVKSSVYTKTETNSNISTAVASYLPLAGGELTGNLVMSGTSPQLQFETSSSNPNFQIAVQESIASTFEISSGATDADATNDTYVPRLSVNASGRVGIGTGSSVPDAGLKVITAETGIAASWIRGPNYGLRVSAGSTDAHYALRIANASDSVLATFNGDGMVGIGTSSPSTKLEVSGTAKADHYLLDTIAKSISDTANDVFVYDTRKDSDGGAWRHRTQNTSWYNETLNTSTRGGRKEFPRVAVIVAETGTVTIYDADDSDMPMWMTFPVANTSWLKHSGSGGCKAVVARDGIMVTGGDLRGSIVRFVADDGNVFEAGYNYEHRYITTRNGAVGKATGPIRIAHNSVSDVAITVLPNAPIDADTGLPVPTIAVATYGGITIIKDTPYELSGNPTCVDITTGSGGYNSMNRVSISPDGWVAWSQNDTRSAKAAPIPEQDKAYGFWTYGQDADNDAYNFYESHAYGTNLGNIPALVSVSGGIKDHIFGKVVSSSDGLTLIGLQKSEPAGVYGDANMPLTAYVTSNYNTGWMNTSTAMSTLSDTDTTNAVGAEFVTNGTFASNITGWTLREGNGTFSASSGVATLTYVSNATSWVTGLSGLTIGKTYTLSFDLVSASTASVQFYYNHGTGSDLSVSMSGSTAGTYSATFIAAATTATIFPRIYASGNMVIDNVSVRLAEADRSWNNKGIPVYGTVTKSAVATGAELVAYSGFNGNNYLRQPYNADLQFGTGSFSIMGWYKVGTVSSTYRCLVYINSVGVSSVGSTNHGFQLLVAPDETLYSYIYGPSADADSVTTVDTTDGKWHMFCHVTEGNSDHKLYVDGVLRASSSSTIGNINNANAELMLGAYGGTPSANAFPFTDGSLSNIRIAKAPISHEKIVKIYNDEKHLYGTNAKATLYGTSNNPLAIAYDDDAEQLHVGTSAGRSVFQGLSRVDNTTDAVGTSISASNGLVAEE